jgi:hypothetical protein
VSFTNETVFQKYLGNGSQTTFPIPFYTIANNPSHIKVYLVDNATLVETLLTKDTDYTLEPSDNSPVEVEMVVAPTAQQSLLIYRELPITQPTTYTNTGPFQKEDFERSLDKIVMQVQQLGERVGRALLYPRPSGFTDKALPTASEDSALVMDSLGNVTALSLNSIEGGTYNGSALKYPSLFLNSAGTTNIPSNAAYSFIYSSGASAKTINLPSASSVGIGRFFVIAQDGTSGAITVNRTGGDTIDGLSTLFFGEAYNTYMFVSNGISTWSVNTIKQQQVTSANLVNNAATASKVQSTTTSQTSNFTLSNIFNTVLCNTTAGSFTCTLFAIASNGQKMVHIKNTGTANVLTVDANASETIDGTLTKTLLPGESMTIVSPASGTNWNVVSFTGRGIVSATTNTVTPPASGRWYEFTGNALVLTPGRWRLFGLAMLLSDGGSPSYGSAYPTWSSAAGDGSASPAPAALSLASNLSIVSSFTTYPGQSFINVVTVAELGVPYAEAVVDVTATTTVYGNCFSTQGTPANGRITLHLNAIKIGV